MHTMGKPDHITPEFPSEEAEFEAVPRHMDTLQIVSVVYTYILAYLVLSTKSGFKWMPRIYNCNVFVSLFTIL